MDPCYELIAERVAPEAWTAFRKKLIFGFKGFPEDWELDPELRERLVLKLQWHFYNPDLTEGIADKRNRCWAFVSSFLDREFRRRFTFLRSRLDEAQMACWDRDFADFETLLFLSSMTEPMRLDWLAGFESRIRHGHSRRVKIIKNKGAGLSSDLLGVTVLMAWPEIKARYRFLLKRHHPDMGGDPATTKRIIEEFGRLKALRQKRG